MPEARRTPVDPVRLADGTLGVLGPGGVFSSGDLPHVPTSQKTTTMNNIAAAAYIPLLVAGFRQPQCGHRFAPELTSFPQSRHLVNAIARPPPVRPGRPLFSPASLQPPPTGVNWTAPPNGPFCRIVAFSAGLARLGVLQKHRSCMQRQRARSRRACPKLRTARRRGARAAGRCVFAVPCNCVVGLIAFLARSDRGAAFFRSNPPSK